MFDLTVPAVNPNDDRVRIAAWRRGDGDEIAAGEIVAELETSKELFDLPAPAAGFLRIAQGAGAECTYGSVIGRLFGTREEALAPAAAIRAGTDRAPAAFTLTRDAESFAREHAIEPGRIAELGLKLVRKGDLERLLTADGTGGIREIAIPAQQQAVSRVVTRSLAEIPQAFHLQKIRCGALLAALAARGPGGGVGITEFLVRAVARLAPDFPFFYGRRLDDRRFITTADPGVGVTLDLGRGLYVPVVRNAARRDLPGIARTLMEFRLKGMRGAFRSEDLAGGDITISLNTGEGTILVDPLVLPPQTCMISLAAILRECSIGPDGSVHEDPVFHLGIAYDHRVINGGDVARYLDALRRAVENADVSDPDPGTSL